MTKKGVRLLALGSLVVFFILITSSDLGSLEQTKSKIRLVRLIALDEGNESDQEFEAYRYDAAKKGYIVNFAIMMGYTDSKDDTYFPIFNISLKKVEKFLVRVDFMCTATATLLIDAYMVGIDTFMLLDREEVKVKKNVSYQAEFEVEKRDLMKGVYDILVMIRPEDKSVRFISTGGQALATARVKLDK